MESKSSFFKKYLEVPDKKTICYGVFAALVLVNFWDVYVIHNLLEVGMLGIEYKTYSIFTLKIIIAIFDVFSAAIIIWPSKFCEEFILQTTFAMTGSSLYHLYVANRIIYLYLGFYGLFYSIASLVLFILVILFVFINVKVKMSKKLIDYRKTKLGLTSVAFVFATIGVLIPKPQNLNQSIIVLAIILHFLSYSFALTSSGFHKYFLLKRMR